MKSVNLLSKQLTKITENKFTVSFKIESVRYTVKLRNCQKKWTKRKKKFKFTVNFRNKRRTIFKNKYNKNQIYVVCFYVRAKQKKQNTATVL